MRTKVLNYSILFLLAFLVQTGSFAQNHVWTLPGQAFNLIDGIPQPLPTASPLYDGYDGSPAEHAHNSIAKPNGEVLFFVVDNHVYNELGHMVGELYSNTYSYAITGYTEVVIVPDPANCDRYYIISSGSGTSLAESPYRAHYALLDMSLPSYWDEEGSFGRLVDGNGDPISGYQTCSPLVPSGYVQGGGLKTPCVLAATNPRPDGSHFLFIFQGETVFRYLIDENGIQFDNYQYTLPGVDPFFGGASQMRCEMALIERPLGHGGVHGGYRIALPYRYYLPATNFNAVYVADVSNTGNILSGSANIVTFLDVINDTPHLHGLEFSNDGETLYIVHNPTSSNPDPIEYFEWGNPQAGSVGMNLINAEDFQFSQISTGTDNKLYFATNNRLATLEFADLPEFANWNDNAFSGINYSSNSIYATTPSDILTTYMLPNQIHNMDYTQYPVYPYSQYAATLTAQWTPTSNPFTTGSETVRISDELTIPAGVHITIKDMRFEFFDEARVVIEPGGQLTMDNTIFTSGPCGSEMWLGVEVWGDPQSAQTPLSNQGYLRMENNSVIEHAHIGALASRRANSSGAMDLPGGVIRAEDSRFRNNHRDVFIRDYIRTSNSGNIIPNYCDFRNCDFLTDGPLNIPTITPWFHAHLDRVARVNFRDCSWRNTASFGELEIHERGIGIFAQQAPFRITGQNETYESAHEFLPITDNVHQSFYQLNAGVLAWGAENHPFTVSKMEFQLNRTGIIVFGASFETITFNNFEVPEAGGNYPSGDPIHNIGAYLMDSHSFTVEENYFFSTPQVSRNGGIVIDNSSLGDLAVENEIYRNQFYALNFGIGVKRDNRSRNMGLQARCNVFSTMDMSDIVLAPESEWRDAQGAPTTINDLTNNSFSTTGFPCVGYRDVRVSPDYGINSQLGLQFQYFHSDHPITTPDMDYLHPTCPQLNMENMLPTAYINEPLIYSEHCPSNFSSGGGGKWPIAELKQKQATATSDLESAEAIYKATIDGGDSEDIIDLLQNIFDEESAYLRDLLMARYPLSREALIAAIEAAESFDPWHLTQVLVANSRLPGDVYLFLKDNEVLSPFFMQFVDDAQTTGMASFRTLLKAEITYRSYEKSHAERAINRHFLHHSDSVDVSAWNSYLESRDEPYYQLYRIGSHIDLGETGLAQSLLDSLETDSSRVEWVQFMIDLVVADTVTSSDIDKSWDFFYNDPATIGSAWGWLLAHGETDSIPGFEEELEHRNLLHSSANTQAKPERFLQAYPNPAKDRVVLTYPKEAEGMGIVQMFDADGRLVHEFTASDAGFQEINITGWPTGLYIAKLIVNGKDFETVKISVVK